MSTCNVTPSEVPEFGQRQPYFGKQALSTQESSHDTLNPDNFKNWLARDAGLGIYAHGRVHQEIGYSIFVGDLIHKRGHLMTDDILLMEEQDLLSMGEPLSAPSRLGALKSLAVLPTMQTANGEGALIAYYDRGVVSFDTFEAPRETRHDGDGTIIQKGWDTKRLVNHLLNTVSAVGRYAVAVLTRDHLFRSVRGLHFLKTVLGDGSFRSEQVNRISTDVDPLLDQDKLLEGAACGYWIEGDRMFATTGMIEDDCYSATSFGRGFVSWNQAYTFTDDRTPIPLWEGLWLPDAGIKAVHCFSNIEFGFICSDIKEDIYLGVIDKTLNCDNRDGVDVPIEWSFETGRFAPLGLGATVAISDCVVELLVSSGTQPVRIYSRADTADEWLLWKTLTPVDKPGQLLITESLGAPPKPHREATWIQVRVEGAGPVEFRLIEIDYSSSTTKACRSSSRVVASVEKPFFP